MKKILAYRFSAFGDIAMTIPVCIEFLEQNPETEIVFVSRENFRDLFESRHPRLHFFGIDLNHYKGILGLWKLAKLLRKEIRPDFVADFHNVLRSQIMNVFFIMKSYKISKIDKGKIEKKKLTDIWNLNKKQLKKTTERYADVLRELGFSVKLSNQIKLASGKKSGIGFAPFAQHKGKMLPLEKSFELAKILAKNSEVYFFGGGEKEIEILEKWESQILNTQNFAGKLSLKEQLGKISGLETMISMDSANMHLASLVGTRCVSVWGSTHNFAGFLGYGQNENDIVEESDLTCRPCSVFGKKKCFRGDYACLEELDIQKIIDKI